MSASRSFKSFPEFMKGSIALLLPFALKSFVWLVFISESGYTLPSSVSQVIATLLRLSCYLACVLAGPVVLNTGASVWTAALGQHHDKDQLPDWIIAGVTFVVTDGVTSYFLDPAFISQLVINVMATVLLLIDNLLYFVYIICLLLISYLFFILADYAIQNTMIWWPELIHTSIAGLTLLLLNMMWGSPFVKPSTDSDMETLLVGIGVYLIFIVYSMAVSYNYFGRILLLKTFVISLTFVLLDIFVQPSSVSNIFSALVGLTGMIATSLMSLFFLLVLSFVVFMFIHTWAEILFPSAGRNYPAATFVSIIGLSFMVMKAMLGIPVKEPSIFSNMKVGLLGIIDMINEYHSAYVVIRNLSIIAVPLLSMQSRNIVSMYTTAAFIVALGLVLTLPPGPGMPAESPASTLVTDDFVQQTIKSFVTSQTKGIDGEIEQLTDS